MTMDLEKIEEILDRTPREREQLIGLLQDLQHLCRYLPGEVLHRVAGHLGVSLADVYGVARFYAAFSLEPRGRVLIQICEGTACHVRGALGVGDALKRQLALPPQGGTTPDMEFTLKGVNCVGACALGPLVIVDGEYHGNQSPGHVPRLVKKLRKANAKE